jgi:Bacterial TSP3 repeat
MELPARTRLKLRRAAITAALGALLVPATAGAATTHTPTITKIAPKTVFVGDTLTVYGKHFVRGKGKNTVLFRRDGGRQLFVKADVSTTKQLRVVIPVALQKYMAISSGQPVATRFRLRVLAKRLSRSFTKLAASPLVGPASAKPAAPAGGGAPPADGDCDGDGVKNGVDPDDDNDGLPDTLELQLRLDPCNPDTDGDGVSDGYEYASAVDLNNDDYRNPSISLPYPGKRAYPNPLDGSDANTDYDGDGLTMAQEYALWKYTVAHGADPSLQHLTYSDGLKYSIYTRDANGRRVPALAAAGYSKHQDFLNAVAAEGYSTITYPDDTSHAYSLLDFDRSGAVTASEDNYLDWHGAGGGDAPDGYLSDDERDEDGDGLSNWAEDNGWMTSQWWKARYNKETPFQITYASTSATDPDSDGDGIVDGADDQDHDDYPNVVEADRLQITASSGHLLDDPNATTASPNPWYGRVNPFNPCLPYVSSRTCPTFIPFSSSWAPFDGPPYNSSGTDLDYLVLR